MLCQYVHIDGVVDIHTANETARSQDTKIESVMSCILMF